jgi:hypothetical protein
MARSVMEKNKTITQGTEAIASVPESMARVEAGNAASYDREPDKKTNKRCYRNVAGRWNNL